MTNRWHREYIGELQMREKLKKPTGSLKLNQLLLIKDNNLPSMKWSLGRIKRLTKGIDDVNRVATVKTADGIFASAVVRLCPLSTES